MKNKLAVAGFVLGLVSFVQLFGLEKAVLAVIFGAISLKEITSGQQLNGKKYAYAAIILGSVYILIILVLAVVKGPEIFKLLGKMR
ncbi:MAG: DUF4190 domain-containing protein [Elusimicrobiota bacterium]|nr:DUF4190 domain-containing protein [Elusimicrobiota bacterium]